MQSSSLQTVFRVIGIVLLPIAGLFCLLCFGIGDFGLSLAFGISVAAAIYLISGAPHVLRAVDAFPKITSEYEADRAFIQVGGARYGRSFWRSANCTIPLARFRASKEALVITISILGRTYAFPRSSVRRLSWKRAPFSLGLQIEHDVDDLPPFVLFWVSNREAMTQGLRSFGYEISNT